MLCKPSEKLIQNGTRIDDLPFQVEVPEVKFPNHEAVGSFDKFFCQALSLVCNSAVEIVITGFFFQEDKSFQSDSWELARCLGTLIHLEIPPRLRRLI